MNIIFFGSSQFAGPSLRALINSGHKILCAVTRPDKPKGRHLHLSGTVIKSMALESGLRVYQPENVNAEEPVNLLKGMEADLFAVVSYGQILSPGILALPKIFSINAHASLLPRYRGAAPINRAIINGEEETGVTIIKLTSRMDAGPVILRQAAGISDEDTDISLEDKLSGIASRLLLEALGCIENNDCVLTPQDENEASFAPKLSKEEGLIHWEKPARDIYNLIRGITKWPGAFTYYKGKLLKIYKAKVCRSAGLPVCRSAGEIIRVEKDGIAAAAGEGDLIIEELQIEGKRRMKAGEFISGHKISRGERFEKN